MFPKLEDKQSTLISRSPFLKSPLVKWDLGSSVRFGFCKWGCSLCVVQQFKNSLKYFLLREFYFPLTLTLSPIGGEGKKLKRFNYLTHFRQL